MMIDTCPACGASHLESVWRLARIPVHSCLMMSTRKAALEFPCGEMNLTFCHSCGFMFNAAYEAELQSYSPDYEETQAYSPRFQQFLDEICRDQTHKYLPPDKLALEIGCGKGEFLVRLCEWAGCRGIGIDPGYRPERTVSPVADRLTFLRDFYGPKYKRITADYITCRHTLEHIGPVQNFMQLVRETIGSRHDTVLFFELPDMKRVLQEQAFWDIYYEHCSYFTLGSLTRLFERTGFDVHETWYAYDNQYLMLEARPTDPNRAAFSIQKHVDDVGGAAALVEQFKTAISTRVATLRREARQWYTEGKRVAVWGSGSKAVAYLITLGLREEVSTIIDINPNKWGKFLAGTGHEISSPASLQALKPDIIVIMNPIYVDEIRASLRHLNLTSQVLVL